MAFRNNNDDDNPQNTTHCVLIDGDYGRHELFSNIHPYTLNRLGKLNDTFTFETYTGKALKLMNDTSNIHYHIFYNSFSVEIDEYYKTLKLIYPQSVWLHSSINTTADKNYDNNNTLQIQNIMSTHESDYIWIIYGIETHYKELIKQLKSNKNLKSNISCYSWLENLKDGSNRIEYLYNNKIENSTEHQIEELGLQPVLSQSMTLTTESTDPKKKQRIRIKCGINGCKKMFKNDNDLGSHQLAKHTDTQSAVSEKTLVTTKAKIKQKKRVKCDFEGCNKQFKNANALKDHQSAKHIYTHPVINDEVPMTTTSETEMSKKIDTPKIECGFDGCKQSYKECSVLQEHQIAAHQIPLRCLFSQKCIDSNKEYSGIQDLSNHLAFQHADSFPRQICPIPNCENWPYGCDWSAALQHIWQSHREYLLHDSVLNLAKEIPTTNIPCWDIGGPYKCSYRDCSRWYWEEESLKRHEAFEHPVPLVCPFISECQRSRRRYNGLLHLRRHVIKVHAPLFSHPACFDSECKTAEKKPFISWPEVLRHILLDHLSAVGITTESTASSTKKTGKISKKCCYDTCDVLFKTREKFQYHLVTCHPHPLRCPYNSECNNVVNGKVYAGLMELAKHIKEEHSVQFSKPMCFENKCQNEKQFTDWSFVIKHILQRHLLDIKSN